MGMLKKFIVYTGFLISLVPSLHSATGGYIVSTNSAISTNGLNFVFSQTVSFSDLKTDSLSIRFPYIDTAFLSYPSVNPSFNMPVDELGRIVKVSISAVINSTDGSVKIGPNTTALARSYLVYHTAWANILSPDLQARGVSLGGGLSFLQGANEIDVSGTKSGVVTQGQTINGTFAPDFIGYSLGSTPRSFSTSEQMFGFADFSKFMGAGDFEVQLDAEVFSSLGTSLPYEVIPPSFFGDLILTYEIIPEPSAASLLALGLTGLVALRRCRRNAV